MEQNTTVYDRQLAMQLANLDLVPPIQIPEGYEIHTLRRDSPQEWEAIVDSAFGTHEDFEKKVVDRPGYCPERVYFVRIDGKAVATATSYNHPAYPGRGFLHMVATHRSATRKGAGRLAVLAVLHGLRQYGLSGCILTTDDFRLPAIRMYLGIGFQPVIDDAEMGSRWNKVREALSGDLSRLAGEETVSQL